MSTDVAVVGAGAAGLFAAIFAAREGARVVLLEKNARPGLKILISGGGRCNLTTTLRGRELESQYGKRRGRWLRHALRAFGPEDLVAWVESAGVPLQEEDLDKIFPVSGRAGDVLDALLRKADEAGVEIRRETGLASILPEGEAWRLDCGASGSVAARRVILSTGGLSYPKTGTTGDGYRICADLGHEIIPPRPALAPLFIEADWVRQLSGVTLVEIELILLDGHGKVVRRRRRPVLFTHKGLTGPGAMDLAGDVEEGEGASTVVLDFAPDQSREELDADLQVAARTAGRKSSENCLPRVIPERLRKHLVAAAGAQGPIAELRKDARRRLVGLVKSSQVSVSRSLGFKNAEVTRGGVALGEVDGRTMESKLVPGLHLCGEILDVDGPIGGFNFQAAFATGRLAGIHAARAVRSPPDP